MRVWDMCPGVSLEVSPSDHRRLETLIRDRNTAQKHIRQAEIVLLSAAGSGTVEIMGREFITLGFEGGQAYRQIHSADDTRGPARLDRCGDQGDRGTVRDPARRWHRRCQAQ